MPLDQGFRSAQAELGFRVSKRSSGFRWLFVMNSARRERMLRELPRPEKIFHRVEAHSRADGIKWEMQRWKPSVYLVLDPLHGHRGQQLQSGFYVVNRPPIAERIDRYLKALGIVCEFSSWEDLLPVAVFRRQVTNVGGLIEIDLPLYLLIAKAASTGFFRPVELKYLAERMPPRSHIRGLLYRLAVRDLKKCITSSVHH